MPRFHIEPPSHVASPYGLLSVVDARYDEPSPHWRQGVEWDSLCGKVNTTYDPCFSVTDTGTPPPTPPAKTSELTFEDRGAQPFTVVARFDCSPAAWAEHAQELGEDALTRLEAYQVERTFWTGMAGGQEVVFPHLAADAEVTDGSTVHPVLLQTAATPVTGTSLSLVEGLGLLEQALADCYGSAGVIHVPASLGPALAAERLIERDGARRLRTLNGNLVALGGGYPGTGPDGSTPAQGHAWIYATGNVFAYRSRVEVPPLPSIVDRANNTASALAERTYVLGWDCCHLAVEVEITELGGGGVESSDIQAVAPLSWDANTDTMSLEPGTDGQYLATDGGVPTWETPGQPGTLPGPLDGSGRIPAGQLPPTPLHETFEAASEAEMLAAPVSAPAVCIRTDFTPPHLFYLHTDPASDIGNWTDLGAGISTGADPTAQVGTAVINGAAATYMRSDAAPAINQAMSPTWTGHHTFGGALTVTPAAAAGRVLTSDAGGNATWQALPAAPVQSVAGKTGAVSLVKGDVGLSNVDNTSDVAKPVSTAQQAALDLKFTTPTPLIPKVLFGTPLSNNTPGLVGYEQDVLGDTIAMRTFGGTVKTATPADDNDAATKLYVDDLLESLASPTGGSGLVLSVNGKPGPHVQLAPLDVGSVPVTGGTMTGPLLIDQNVAGVKARLAMKLPGTQNDAPTTFGVNATYLGIGGGEWNLNSYRLIGLGYIAAAGNEYPAVVGYQETSTSSNTRGDLVFGVRPNNNNIAPTIALRVRSDGQILAEAGAAYTPTADGSLTTRKYVHDLIDALPAPTGGSATWGGITGTLASQTDLQAALDAKATTSALTTHEGTTGAGTHLPAGGTSGQVPVKGAGNTVAWQDPPAGAAAWGSISGTMSAQTDLQQELDGRVLLTSKATQTQAEAGADDTKWMSALNVSQAIAAHQGPLPETYTNGATTDEVVNSAPPGEVVAFGPTPSDTAVQQWSIQWFMYLSAASPTTVTFAVAPQPSIPTITSGVGPAPGATAGSPTHSAADGALTFQVDTEKRLYQLVTHASTPGTVGLGQIVLGMGVAAGVDVTVHAGSHTVANKITTAS